MPRASMWTLLTPLLVLANQLQVITLSESDLLSTADLIDSISRDCAVERVTDDNPAKLLALQLAPAIPMVWGTGVFADAVAYRFTSQLAENAKLVAVHGEIPESQHNQVVVFDGPLADAAQENIFEDLDGVANAQFRLVLLRDNHESERISRRASIVSEIAQRRKVPVSSVSATGEHLLHRLASLVAITDWASVYTALALGIDPSPIGPINELKARLASERG